MSEVTSVGTPDPVVGIKMRNGKWRCPSCGDVEVNEYVLTINHGFSGRRDPGYWWVNHGCCYRLQDRLFRLGWYPLGWGPAADIELPGHLLTIREEESIWRTFDRSRFQWQRSDLLTEVVAEEVAAKVAPMILDRILDRMGDADLLEVSDRIEAKVKARVQLRLDDLVAQYEAEGVPFGTGESLDRALAALCEAEGVVPSGNDD